MAANISRVGQLSFPGVAAVTHNESLGASPSGQEVQAAIHHGIQQAAANFSQIAGANVFVAETAGGETTLRFGDGKQGTRVPSESKLDSAYRAGSGASGNQPTSDQALWAVIRMRTSALR